MVDSQYTDPRLVELYDTLNPAGPDTDFYLSLLGSAPIAVADLGCGTGLLARRIAGFGHTVIGLDPAPAMLAIARRNDPDGHVKWIEGDARERWQHPWVDLAILSGHAFQVFLDDHDVGAVLTAAASALSPLGTLAFETRNPERRSWERWTPEWSTRRVTVAGMGEVQVSHQLLEVAEERDHTLVQFETSHMFPGDSMPVVGVSTLRFTSADVLEALLRAAGFTDVVMYGDWDRSPLSTSSPEIIVVARRGRGDADERAVLRRSLGGVGGSAPGGSEVAWARATRH